MRLTMDTLCCVMGPVLVLWILQSTAASVGTAVTVDPGQDATLPCRSADSSIIAVEWSRPDLVPDYVLFYSDGYLETDNQNPNFMDRVDMVDRDLKNGDMSLTLKNVNINDAGTYECRVASGGSRRKKRNIINSEPIRIIRLQVTGSPGDRHHGLVVGVLVLAVAVGAAVAGVLTYKRHKDKRSGPPADDDDADEASGEKLV